MSGFSAHGGDRCTCDVHVLWLCVHVSEEMCICVIWSNSRYKGHKHNEYKVHCCLSHDDVIIVCGAEDDGKIWFWDLRV